MGRKDEQKDCKGCVCMCVCMHANAQVFKVGQGSINITEGSFLLSILALPSESQRPPGSHSIFPLPKFNTQGNSTAQHRTQSYVWRTDQLGIIYNTVITLLHA